MKKSVFLLAGLLVLVFLAAAYAAPAAPKSEGSWVSKLLGGLNETYNDPTVVDSFGSNNGAILVNDNGQEVSYNFDMNRCETVRRVEGRDGGDVIYEPSTGPGSVDDPLETTQSAPEENVASTINEYSQVVWSGDYGETWYTTVLRK